MFAPNTVLIACNAASLSEADWVLANTSSTNLPTRFAVEPVFCITPSYNIVLKQRPTRGNNAIYDTKINLQYTVY